MKIRLKLLFLIIAIAAVLPQKLSAADKFNPVGKWEFSVPEAPYGYNVGSFEVKIVDEKYEVNVSFEGMDYKFEGEMIFFDKDKFSFSIYVEGEDVLMDFAFSEKDVMSGKATYSEGELLMSAKRVIDKKD